jgi:hypothetical protein
VVSNTSLAEDEAAVSDPAVPVELYGCKYNEGMGSSDLDKVVATWNDWADDHGMDDYTAWTLTKFYSGPEQDFDYLWMGVSSSAKSLGAAQDDWIANGGKAAAAFEKLGPCEVHANYAAVNFKPPARGDGPPSSLVMAFSDCNIAEGKSFGEDVAPALGAWAKYRTDHGSSASIWAFFPVYGGGGEEHDFKYVTGHTSHEQQGIDWDAYSAGGYIKAGEIFGDVLVCDSSRVYNATLRRNAEYSDE